jgi:hypothetical protein
MNNEEEEEEEHENPSPLFTVFPASAKHVVTQELPDDPVSVAVTTDKMTDDQDVCKEPNRKKRIRLDANHLGTIDRGDNEKLQASIKEAYRLLQTSLDQELPFGTDARKRLEKNTDFQQSLLLLRNMVSM